MPMGKLTSVFAILAVALLAGAPPWAAAADDLNKEAAEVDQKIAKELADAERLKEMKKQQPTRMSRSRRLISTRCS